jgi:3-hydroxybutyryl-CoA dehydrogenase
MSLAAIRTISAIGAGAMGAGTAQCFAMAGYPVRLYDISDTSIANGIKSIETSLADYRRHGLVQAAQIPAIMGRITPTTDLAAAAGDADFIIESVVENLAVKQDVFGKLESLCPAHTIFATNTSGLSPTQIAAHLTRKDRFVVTHFWNPPQLLPLVEVVPGAETSEDTMRTAYQLMQKIGKQPVWLKRECPGFVGNRLQLALLREALHLLAEGIASADDIDLVVETSLGRRLAVTGPLKSADLGGLDVFRSIFSYLGPDLSNATDIPPILEQAVQQGKLGGKTGAGLSDWPAARLAEFRARRANELLRHLVEDRDRLTQQAS